MASLDLRKWSCLACTYLNEPVSLICEICSTPAPASSNEGQKRVKLTNNSSPKSSKVGPAAFLAAMASLSPTTTALNTPLAYQIPPTISKGIIPKRDPGAGQDKIRLITWNTDGIYEKGYCEERAIEASALIIAESPDVIVLQELVPESLSIFKTRLERAGYNIILPQHKHPAPYFCSIFTSNCLTSMNSFQKPFECGSYMYRDLSHTTITNGPLGNKKLHIYTSHLESMKSQGMIGQRSQDYRIKQFFEIITNHMMKDNENMEASLFAGDTNLRNDEIMTSKFSKENNLEIPYNDVFRPKKTCPIIDAYEQADEPNEHKFTWDCLLNDNLVMESFKPRARYDRCFMTRNLCQVHKESFHLIGKSKFPVVSNHGSSMFPSDHFGICMDLTIN